MKSIYTIPKVVKYDDLSKSWFVYFRYDKKLFRYKYGINYIDNYKKRLDEAIALKDALLEKLKEGWNPNIPDVIQQHSELTFNDALDFALDKKETNISKKTYSGYSGTVNFMKAAVRDLKFDNLLIEDTKRLHVKLIIEKAKENRYWSNNAFNKHLNHLKAILSELIQWDIIESNPAHKINNLAVSESDANIPACDEDIEKIKTELSTNHKQFYNFILTIFHTGIRPEEILKIKISMVNFRTQEIILPAGITKTNIKRIVPINNHLLSIYESMNIDFTQPDYYLFGSYRESGKGNVGKFIDFIPGPTHINRDTATKRWERIVKKDLGIQMNMYAMKHLGANKKILAGLSMESLKDLFGHKSKLTTQIYVTNLKEISRKEILEKSPEM